MHRRTVYLWAAVLAVVASSCGRRAPVVEGEGIRIEFNDVLHSRVVTRFADEAVPLGGFSASETVTVDGREVTDFRFTSEAEEEFQDGIGAGRRYVIIGEAGGLRKTVTVDLYEDFPRMALFRVRYTNTGNEPVAVGGWKSHAYRIDAAPSGAEPAFWSFQGGTYEDRRDWVVPLEPGFSQRNYQGMTATDYGGGTPVVDVWRRDAGLAVGHVEMVPKLVSLPVAMPDERGATVAVEYEKQMQLSPGESLETFRTFVAVHQGDYFQALRDYRRVMMAQGIGFHEAPDDAFEPIWCAWGYRRNFRLPQILGALPKVKELGFRWVTLDDGWQTAEGDWYIDRKKFRRGDADMRRFTDRLHNEGFQAQLWWAPMSVDPGTDLIEKHPEQLLLNEDGSRRKITWWDAYYLCPAYPDVVEDARRFTIKALRDWGFDGLKIDGQFLNAVPPCYNPAHQHQRPEESVEALPDFFKAIYEAAVSVKPDALIEICPCGTAYSFFLLPHMNMAVASDPLSSWQVRLKGKTLKALMGDGVAYFGDHVELSDGGGDFASTVGVGGVVGTEFVWPPGSGGERDRWLTAEKEREWKRWIDIYKAKMLSRGEYLGELYDIGFDRPEAHAIRKAGKLYYAFFAGSYRGPVELRGLEARSYAVTDYVAGKPLGTVQGPVGRLEVAFEKHLLLEAAPE